MKQNEFNVLKEYLNASVGNFNESQTKALTNTLKANKSFNAVHNVFTSVSVQQKLTMNQRSSLQKILNNRKNAINRKKNANSKALYSASEKGKAEAQRKQNELEEQKRIKEKQNKEFIDQQGDDRAGTVYF
jgi:hypothetical protein